MYFMNVAKHAKVQIYQHKRMNILCEYADNGSNN